MDKQRPLRKYEAKLVEKGKWETWMCLHGALHEIFPQTAETVQDFIQVHTLGLQSQLTLILQTAKVLLQKKKEAPERWNRFMKGRQLKATVQELKATVQKASFEKSWVKFLTKPNASWRRFMLRLMTSRHLNNELKPTFCISSAISRYLLK